MPLNIRTTYSNLSAKGAALYQRALQFVGIPDCTEMRVTTAVAVCVVIYYIICLVAVIVQTVTATTTITALVQ